jgi:hypothetical protein
MNQIFVIYLSLSDRVANIFSNRGTKAEQHIVYKNMKNSLLHDKKIKSNYSGALTT